MAGTPANGYGGIAKTLHWLTVAAFVLQLVVGYVMSADADCDPPGGGPQRRRHLGGGGGALRASRGRV